jgi:TRAP-type mannitol/chloroaromatic compound transport system substrate-binding protein
MKTTKQNKPLGRRDLLKGAAVGGAAAAAATAFPAPAISQDTMEWRMVTTWPKNFPGLGTGAELLAQMIGEMSGGRLNITVYGGGEIVPAFESIEAVGSGTVEMGHGAPYYWKGKVPATQFLASIPFGLTAQEQNAWFQYAGGQELADEAYRELNCKFFPSGNTGVQMGGWFNKEINSLEDYKGLKMRIPGLGGEVVAAAGATVVNLPGGEIPPALASGSLDATEWVGPYNDLAFGLYQNAKYYYYPGWHEPATVLDNFINLDAWNSLTPDLQAIIQAANTAVNQLVLSEFTARNNDSLQVLLDDHGVDVRPFPDEVLIGLGDLAKTVVAEIAAQDPLSTKVYDSIRAFRKNALNWMTFSEQAYLRARALGPSWG